MNLRVLRIGAQAAFDRSQDRVRHFGGVFLPPFKSALSFDYTLYLPHAGHATGATCDITFEC